MKNAARLVVVVFRAGKWSYHNYGEKNTRNNFYGPESGTFQGKNMTESWSIIARLQVSPVSDSFCEAPAGCHRILMTFFFLCSSFENKAFDIREIHLHYRALPSTPFPLWLLATGCQTLFFKSLNGCEWKHSCVASIPPKTWVHSSSVTQILGDINLPLSIHWPFIPPALNASLGNMGLSHSMCAFTYVIANTKHLA